MYSVMIVDDEPIIRMGLKKIVNWEEYGFRIACEARDGEDALGKLNEHQVDFIVTDIRMPKLSGIDLLREIRERGLKVEVLLLSGYDDFSYAQQGLRLGAFDYILKPLDAGKLKSTLVNAFKKLSEKDKEYHELNMSKLISREKILYDLLRGKNLMMMDEYISQYDLPLIKGKVQVAIVEINEIVTNSHLLIDNLLRDELEKSVSDLIENELHKSKIDNYSILDEDLGKKFIIVQTDKEIDISVFNNDFVAVLNKILEAGNEELGTELNIAVGNPYNQLYSMHKSYLNAKEALKYKYVIGTNKLIHISELVQLKQENFIYPIEKENALISAIILGKESEALTALKELIKQIMEISSLDAFKINLAFTQLVSNVYNNVLKKYSFLKDVYDLSKIMNIGFLGVQTLNEVEKKLTDNITSLVSVIKEYNLNRNDNIVQRACEYVLNHIEEDITLSSISENLNISKNYFCSIFKQQTGENFLEYVTRAKMERAKILLKKHDYRVYEVSEALGYKETAYFSRLFKKHFNCTPAEYKKNDI